MRDVWEYRVIDLPSGGRQQVQDRLNELAMEGWSLVTLTEFQDRVGGTIVLKRQRR